MRISVQLFALARELAGSDRVEVELPSGAVVGDLSTALAEQWPALADVVVHATFAVNDEYVDETATISEQAQVTALLPVSGG